MDYPLKSKRVVIAIPVLLLGGTEVHTLALVEALRSGGNDITVCCYYEYDVAMVAQFEEAGAKVLLMKYERAKGLWHLAKGLIQLFKSMKFDIVHIQYIAPGLVPIIAARLARIKTVFATVHIAGSIAYGSKAKFLLWLAASLSTAFFCVSKGVEQFWFGNSQVFDPDKIDIGRKHYTIYNGVDTEKITKIIKETDKDELRASLGIGEKKVLGIVGRLAHQKGHAVLLDALVSVIQNFPDLILLVIGKGPDGERLRRRAEDLKLGNHVKWMGERSQEEAFKLYGIMAIFVMPSLYEGFGLTAAEAMAAGLPVIATNVDGLTEVVEDGVTGILVSVGDMTELAKSIVSLLADRELSRRMGQEGRHRIKEYFSLEQFNTSWLAAYNHLG